MCQCDPVIRLTPEAKRLVCILKTLFFIYVMLIFLEIVFGNYNEAFSGIMIVLLLLMTFMQCYFLMAGYLIFLAAFSAFYALIFIGQRAQNKIAGLPDRFLIHGFYIAVLVLECLMFIYYIILIYYSFQAYKEFKACLLGVGGGYTELNNTDEENPNQRGTNLNPAIVNNNTNPPPNSASFRPFSGQGYTVGGGEN